MSETVTASPSPSGGANVTTPAATPASPPVSGTPNVTTPPDNVTTPPVPGAGLGSIFAAVDGQAPPATGTDGKTAKPDWLDDAFWDAAKGEARLESLARSQRDFRTRVARGEGTLPEAPEGYALPAIEGVPADFVPADDAIWGEVRQAAHKAGVTQTQMDALLRPYLSHAARMKAELAPPDAAAQQEARMTELRAEIGKLGPNGTQMVRELGGRIAGMEARGSLTPEEAGALREIGTAAGVRAMTKLLSLNGERPIPVDALDEGAMTEAEARRTLTQGFAKNDEALLAKGRAALAALEKRGMLGRN